MRFITLTLRGDVQIHINAENIYSYQANPQPELPHLTNVCMGYSMGGSPFLHMVMESPDDVAQLLELVTDE